MASKTVLQLVTAACYRSNAQQVPSALVASTNASDLQLLNLFYAVGEELRALKCWPQLKRTFKLRLVANQPDYDLPLDFYSLLPFTAYDRANSWPAQAPMSDTDWNLETIGTGFYGAMKGFRLFGYGGRQVKVTPTPGDADAGTVISFDYISRSWLQPPAFTASEGSVAQNTYRQARGIIYKKTDSGSDTLGSVVPTMEYGGEGQDGSVRWLAISTSAFSTTTAYSAGTYLTTGGRLYRVKVGGTTGGSAPTSTTENTDITSGTATLRYHSAASWTAQTDFDVGNFILISSQYYRCEVAGKTAVQPTWSTTIFTSNTADLTPQDIAYEAAVADTDFAVFDDELLIEGLRAKLFLARGLGAEDLVFNFERLKRASLGRWSAGKVIDLAAGGPDSCVPSVTVTPWSI